MNDLSQFDKAHCKQHDNSDFEHIPSLDQITRLLVIDSVFGTSPSKCPKNQRASFVYNVLVTHTYQTCKRQDQGNIRRYIRAVTGYSSAQISRHIAAYKQGRKLCCHMNRHAFPKKFTNADRELLAETDNLHQRMNWISTKKICRQMLEQGDHRFTQLAGISVSHLYNFRREKRYKERAVYRWQKGDDETLTKKQRENIAQNLQKRITKLCVRYEEKIPKDTPKDEREFINLQKRMMRNINDLFTFVIVYGSRSNQQQSRQEIGNCQCLNITATEYEELHHHIYYGRSHPMES